MTSAAMPSAGAESIGGPAPTGANEWVNVTTSVRPPPRWNAAMAYDLARDRVVLFGGITTGYSSLNDTWLYDPGANLWANVTTAYSPPAARYPSHPRLVYDSSAGRTLLFELSAGLLEVWEYDSGAKVWAKRGEGGGGMNTRDFVVAYDPAQERTIQFGGGDWAPHFWGLGTNETWLYDYANNTWSQVNPSMSPSRRQGGAMAFDPVLGRVVLFGGCEEATDFNCNPLSDTWAFDATANTWTPLNPQASPPPLEAIVYDAAADGLLAYGEGETWRYDRQSNRWNDQRPAGSPPARSGFAIAYADSSATAVLFGGWGSSSILNETWAYTYGSVPLTVPSAPQNLSALPGPNRVSLSWAPPASTGGYPVTAYRVYRGIPPADPTFLAQVPYAGHTDTNLTTLTTYAYEVSALNLLGEGPRSPRILATPPDTEPPFIQILSPARGEALSSGAVRVSGVASDDVAVARVEVSVDGGVTWRLAAGTSSWSTDVTLEAGASPILARATDSSGNVGQDGFNVSVRAAPPDPVGLSLYIGGLTVLCVGMLVAVLARLGRRRRSPPRE